MNEVVTKDQIKRLIDYCQGDTDMILWALEKRDLTTFFDEEDEDE